MNQPFIVDAHVHTGYPGIFFSPEVDSRCLLMRMDQFQIQYAINLCSMRALSGPQDRELEKRQEEFEESGGRIFYLGFFNPLNGAEGLVVMKKAVSRPGFKGIKIHPSLNKISADDDSYEPVWKFARDNNLPIIAHTWSVSSYNPVQVLSTPEKFERFVKKYPEVRFVLGHSGGRGSGRHEAVRMAKQYKNVYMDFGGDIYSYHYFENMARDVPENKVLFGSDYPWIDPRSHLTRVFLAGITSSLKHRILRDNALEVYGLEN